MTSDDKAAKRATRFLAGLPAVIQDGDQQYDCKAFNLSRSGALLVGRMPRPTSPTVDVTLRSANGDLELRARSRVCRVDLDEDKGETHVATQFVELVDEKDKYTLEALLARVVEGVAPAALQDLPPDATDAQTREALALISLPHRITMAGRAQPREREMLLKDTSPQVLEALARNPQLLAHEVRALLRLHNLLPTTLEVLAHSKWSADEQLRILIAAHPRASFALAERLVGTLSPDGLARAIRQPGLNPALRLKLGKQVKRRF